MGCHLSKPITEKVSSDESSNTLNCGASCMQGWRQTQEDAHNCILDYDTNTSYFAVYDGHGGREVALYCSENLPQFLKQTEAYKNGDMKKALEDAFLEFDATLTTPEVIEKLKKLVQVTPDSEESDDDYMVLENGESISLHSASENVKSMPTNNSKKSAYESSTDRSNFDDTDNIVSSSSSTKNEANNFRTYISDDTKKTVLLNTTKNCHLNEVQMYSLVPEVRVESSDSSVSKSKICIVSNINKLNDLLNQDKEVLSLHTDEIRSCDNITSSSTPQENGDILKTEDSSDKNKDDFIRKLRHGPGFESGCTAVVALLHENELYVANAGDSRCIVCRNGTAVEMSFDHKPVSKEERKRIINARGRVDCDGRVGGLNLSRAIGDHSHKQNKDLSNREQLIIALPDIQTLTIHPDEDEFVFLACDGIWDCISNQKAVDFIRPAIQEGKKKLSQICEEMFDKHVNIIGRGQDNMTAIIVQFKTHVLKRSAEELDPNKRLKTEEI